MNAKLAMRQYQNNVAHGSTVDASPHRLIQLLMEGVLQKVAQAKGNVKRKEVADKAVNITKAINIVAGLRASLDTEQGGEIAANLDSLYDYMLQRLMLANARSDEEILDEVSTLMISIKLSWDSIAGQVAQ